MSGFTMKNRELSEAIVYLFPMFQLSGLASMEYTGKFTAEVLISFAAVFIVMYALVWFTYKKKLFR